MFERKWIKLIGFEGKATITWKARNLKFDIYEANSDAMYFTEAKLKILSKVDSKLVWSFRESLKSFSL